MSTKFWVQDEDGKLDGSLPDVPKKGYAAVLSEKEDVSAISSVVSKVNDMFDPKQEDKRLRELLEMLRKGLYETKQYGRLSQLLHFPAIFSFQETIAMVEMYVQLKMMKYAWNEAVKKGFDPTGLDKYYHCRAHCIATKAGLGEIAASYGGGYAKEVWDLFKNLRDKGIIHGSIYERFIGSIVDSIGDLSANSKGRFGASNLSCDTACDEL